MSFNFKWPTFSEEFHASAAQMLNSALNRGPKPKLIADDILVEELAWAPSHRSSKSSRLETSAPIAFAASFDLRMQVMLTWS